MKKVLLLACLSLMVFALGCKNEQSPSNSGYNTQPKYTEAQHQVTRQSDDRYVHDRRYYERDTGPRATKDVRAEDVI